MIGLGAIYGVAFDVFDDTGALANADTVTLTITLPDGTEVTPTVPSPPTDTGKYRYGYPTTMAGRHTGHAVTANPVTVWDFEFDVETATPAAIISLADAKDQLNIEQDDTSDDDELRGFIVAVTAAVENYLHEVVVRRPFTDEIELCRARRFRVWQAPVISLTSVQLWDGSVTWDTADMRASPSGVVRVVNGPLITGLVDVAYLAGYQVVPYNYRMGALVILQHTWESQRGSGTMMSGVIGPEERFRQPGEFFTLPNKAKEWLGPPRPVVA
jgi:hypothetical protein